jgi:hypothetical protein
VLLPSTVGGDVLVASSYGLDWKGVAKPVAVEPPGLEDAGGSCWPVAVRKTVPRRWRWLRFWVGCRWRWSKPRHSWPTKIFTLADYRAAFATRSAELLEQGRPDDREHGLDVVLFVGRTAERQVACGGGVVVSGGVSCLGRSWRILAEHAYVLPAALGALLVIRWSCRLWCGRLRRYSLVKTANEGLVVHRLVQTVIRNTLSPDQQQWAGVALHLLLVAFPSDVRDPEPWPLALVGGL